MNTKTKATLLIAVTTLLTTLDASALTVGKLTVNELRNPYGIDEAPYLGWTIESEKRNVIQQSYEITLYSDSKCSTPVWTSGKIESSHSQDISLDGASLAPETRYYWDVSVTDNYGNLVRSTEQAYFDTGVMGDWGPAKWIRTGIYPFGFFIYRSLKEYTVEYDVKIIDSTAGVCLFRSRDESSHKVWLFAITDSGQPSLKIYNWSNRKYTLQNDIKLTSPQSQIRANEWFHVKLHISDNAHKCDTYVNNVLVNEQTGYFPDSQLGICQNIETGVAGFDNFRIENQSNGLVLLDENFQGTNIFCNGDVVDGALVVDGSKSDIFWQPAGKPNHSIAADVTILKGNVGVYFGAEDVKSSYLWEIVTNEGNTPKLRRSVATWGAPVTIGNDIPVDILSTNEILNHRRHIKIHVDGTTNYIYTYIDETLVDICKDAPRVVSIDKFGFNARKGHRAYIDNVHAEIQYPDGASATILSDDFETSESLNFMDAEIVDAGGSRVWYLHPVGDDASILQIKTKAPIFYKNFAIDKEVKSAKLYTSALGNYDLWINGTRVGHERPDGSVFYEELKPGWVDYGARVIYSSHDVTSLCRKGTNTIGALVTQGWYHGSISKNKYNTQPDLWALAFLGKLVITYTDGTSTVLGTDEGWCVTEFGPLRYGEIYEGEYYDARMHYPWENGCDIRPFIANSFSYNHSVESWPSTFVTSLTPLRPISITVYEGASAGPDYGEINVVDYIEGGSRFTLKKGQTAVLDFGQNHAGVPSFKVKGGTGTRLRMRFAEVLNDSGLEDRYNDGPKGSIFRRNMVKENSARLYYVLAGKDAGESYQPNSTYYGYRYCELTATDDVDILEFTAVPLTSSHDDAGRITTDNQDINKLFSNILWSQRSDMLSTPLDCPSRTERLGWTGDIRGFATTAMYNAGVAAFLRNWLADLRSSQRSDGAYSDIAPNCLSQYGNAGWADAGITMPWALYMMTGNIEVISENYQAMTKYMDYLSKLTENGLKYPGPGTLYGDWVAIDETDKRYVSQVFYAYDAYLMSKMSKLLSTDANDRFAKASIKYDELFGAIKSEILDVYFDGEGLLHPTQAACVLALDFNICDNARRGNVAATLARLIKENGNRLTTGFIGTVHICQVLCDNGFTDVAYDLLLQDQYPSWLYSVSQGATTIWEYWYTYNHESGFYPINLNSFNHLAFGSIGEWMYSYMAGIKPCEDAPGFRTIVFEPEFDTRFAKPAGKANIRQVNATYDSKYGKIMADWYFDEDNQPVYHIVVPANTDGIVRFPSANEETVVYESGKDASLSEFVSYLGYDSGYKFFSVKSGDYCFTSSNALSEKSISDICGKIKVSPNPVRDKLHISFDGQIDEVQIFSTSGLLMQSVHDNCNEIDCSRLPSGIYILKIANGSNVYTFKVIKR